HSFASDAPFWLKPLPYTDAERLVWFGKKIGGSGGVTVPWVNFKHWHDSNRPFAAMAARQFTNLTMTGRGEPQQTQGLVVTAPYFSLAGMRPLLGRLFGDADDRAGADPVIVLHHRFWSGTLGGDPNIVGATLTLNRQPDQVIVVALPAEDPDRIHSYLA